MMNISRRGTQIESHTCTRVTLEKPKRGENSSKQSSFNLQIICKILYNNPPWKYMTVWPTNTKTNTLFCLLLLIRTTILTVSYWWYTQQCRTILSVSYCWYIWQYSILAILYWWYTHQYLLSFTALSPSLLRWITYVSRRGGRALYIKAWRGEESGLKLEGACMSFATRLNSN